jgi:regulator of sirC expression with transglutaminase-like and TPR domain
MFNQKELQALISLLDDTDEGVIRQVEGKILSLGEEVIPYLESEWGLSFNALQQQRIENIIHRIQFEGVKLQLAEWAAGKEPDLFEGIFLVSKYQYPDLDKVKINNQLNKLRLEVWLELNYKLTALEKVKVLNHVIYDMNGFTGNTSNYHSPSNSFINTVLESRKGNPISLAIVYSIVAQRLGIPIFGVNLPQHFILAYKDDTLLMPLEHLNQSIDLSFNQPGEVLFYINAFNRGVVFSRQNVEQFLKQLRLEPHHFYFQPCSNVEIIKRVLRNVVFAYNSEGRKDKIAELNELLLILGESPDNLASPQGDTYNGEEPE